MSSSTGSMNGHASLWFFTCSSTLCIPICKTSSVSVKLSNRKKNKTIVHKENERTTIRERNSSLKLNRKTWTKQLVIGIAFCWKRREKKNKIRMQHLHWTRWCFVGGGACCWIARSAFFLRFGIVFIITTVRHFSRFLWIIATSGAGVGGFAAGSVIICLWFGIIWFRRCCRWRWWIFNMYLSGNWRQWIVR